MLKRKIWWQTLVTLLILAMVLAACGPAAPEEAAPAEEAAAEEAAPAEEAAAEEAAPAEEEILVAFAYVGPVSDEGWTWTHDVGRQAVEEAFPGMVRTAYIENMPYSEEASRILEQFVADGAKIVVINSEYADFVTKVADAHPDVIFLETNGHRMGENHMWFYPQHWSPTYLIGMAAGLMTETNKLGYVGSFPIPSAYASVNAFPLGAQSVNPDVTTQVVLINSWFDPSAAKQAATALIDGGADFIMDIMDEPAVLQTCNERGVWSATWNTDMRRFGPEKYVSSVSLDWNDFYVSQVQAYFDGTWAAGETGVLLPLAGGVDRDAWGENVPADVQEQVDVVRDMMLNEAFNPFVGPIMDTTGTVRVAEGEELGIYDLYEWGWAVQGVTGLD